MNKEFLLTLALPLAGLTGYGQSAQLEKRPNIILFFVDDMG